MDLQKTIEDIKYLQEKLLSGFGVPKAIKDDIMEKTNKSLHESQRYKEISGLMFDFDNNIVITEQKGDKGNIR